MIDRDSALGRNKCAGSEQPINRYSGLSAIGAYTRSSVMDIRLQFCVNVLRADSVRHRIDDLLYRLKRLPFNLSSQ